MPNWWVYDPLTLGESGEPVLRFLDHAGANFSPKQQPFEHIGSLALQLIVNTLGIDTTPALDPKAKLKSKRRAVLPKSVNAAVIEGSVLFTLERPVKEELHAHYPHAVSRLAAYEVGSLALISFLALDAVPAKLVIVGSTALVLCVDWQKNAYRLFEIDIANPKQMKVLHEVATIDVPPKRSMRDCEKNAGLVLDGENRLLARLYFNHSDMNELQVFERDVKRGWHLTSTHRFTGVDEERPFEPVREGEKIIATADQLWRLFDLQWGRLVTLGNIAVISDADPPHRFWSVDEAGKKGKPLQFSRDGHSVVLNTWRNHVVVVSSKGVDFLRLLPDGSLAIALSIKGEKADEAIFSGDQMILRVRPDASKPPGQEMTTQLWSIG